MEERATFAALKEDFVAELCKDPDQRRRLRYTQGRRSAGGGVGGRGRQTLKKKTAEFVYEVY